MTRAPRWYSASAVTADLPRTHGVPLNGGAVRTAGIACTAVGPQSIKATAAEDALTGSEPTPEAFAEAAQLAADATEPRTDVRGTAEYKRAIVQVFVKRGLEQALEIARAA